MVGGGYYEPIWPSSGAGPARPARPHEPDAGEDLRPAPASLWLTERVWEPQLPAVWPRPGSARLRGRLHFFASGKMPDEVHGHFTTDHLDQEVEVFPISEKLRYLIPFAPSRRCSPTCRSGRGPSRNPPDDGDDGEKFGTWPKTGTGLRAGWLERFFEHLSLSDWIRTVTVSEACGRPQPGRPPHAHLSYVELGEWSSRQERRAYHDLMEEAKRRPDSDRIKPFVRGGYWRMFFDKYEEALDVPRMCWPPTRWPRRSGYVNLLKSQCNCAYWHAFSGALPALPQARDILANHPAEAACPIGWERTSCGWRAGQAPAGLLQPGLRRHPGGIGHPHPPLESAGTFRRASSSITSWPPTPQAATTPPSTTCPPIPRNSRRMCGGPHPRKGSSSTVLPHPRNAQRGGAVGCVKWFKERRPWRPPATP